MIHWAWLIVALAFGFVEGMIVFHNTLKYKYPTVYLELQKHFYEEAKRNDPDDL